MKFEASSDAGRVVAEAVNPATCRRAPPGMGSRLGPSYLACQRQRNSTRGRRERWTTPRTRMVDSFLDIGTARRRSQRRSLTPRRSSSRQSPQCGLNREGANNAHRRPPTFAPRPVATPRRPRHPARASGAALAAGVPASTALGTLPAAAAPPEATILVANFGSDNPASYTLAGEGSALPDVHVLGQGFSGPDAIAVAGNDVFVANQNSNSVTELNASTGAAVRVVSGAAYQITYPLTLAVAGNDLFVANGGSADGSVTKLKASTGTLVKVIAGPPPRFGP